MKMSNHELNQLLHRAVESLQLEGNTLIVLSEITTGSTAPLLPESYWQQEYDRAVDVAQRKTAWLFDRSLEIAQAKMKRRQEDERLSNMSVDELLADAMPTLWAPNELTNWGSLAMARSGSAAKPPTQGPQAPSYDYQCYQCGRPITDRCQGDWTDHAGSRVCDRALMDDDDDDGWHWHMPKPWHGEEEDE